MNFGKTLKRVLQTKEGKFSLLLIVIGCVLAFVFAYLFKSRSISTILQIGCCLLSVFACQQFAQTVVRIQAELEQEEKKGGNRKKN